MGRTGLSGRRFRDPLGNSVRRGFRSRRLDSSNRRTCGGNSTSYSPARCAETTISPPEACRDSASRGYGLPILRDTADLWFRPPMVLPGLQRGKVLAPKVQMRDSRLRLAFPERSSTRRSSRNLEDQPFFPRLCSCFTLFPWTRPAWTPLARITTSSHRSTRCAPATCAPWPGPYPPSRIAAPDGPIY